jgi:hypothetical protein
MQFLLSRSGKVRLESKAARRRNGNFLNIICDLGSVLFFIEMLCSIKI